MMPSVRAELLLMRKRASTWILLGIWTALALVFAYAVAYVTYLNGTSRESLDDLLPQSLVGTTLAGFPFFGGVLALMLGVLPPINDVIDLHSTRIAAGRKHLPGLVVGLLIACSLLALAVIGYGGGIGGHRRAPLTVSLTLLIGLSLWITIDLDHPRAGLLRLSDDPLRALRFDDAP